MNISCRAETGPSLSHEAGFTLLELLIAMVLTSVISAVMFSTYIMVVENGQSVAKLVGQRESERVFLAVLDSDLAGLHLAEQTAWPPLSREPILPAARYLKLTGEEAGARSEDEVVVSFATTNSLVPLLPGRLSAPVCVEYVLRPGKQNKVLIRRERDFCGVEGDFPWTEMVCMRDLLSLRVALLMNGEDFQDAWVSPVRQYPRAVRFHFERQAGGSAQTCICPVLARTAHVHS